MTMTFHRTLFALLLLLLVVAPSTARASDVDTLASLGQRVSVSTSGEAMLTVTAVLAMSGPGDALLPFGFERADSFTVSGRDVAFAADAAGAPAPLRLAARRQLLALVLGPAAATGDTVVVRCRLHRFVDWEAARGQYAAYSLARTFINDSDISFGTCTLTLEVPEGYQVRRITATEPTFKAETSPVPPYSVSAKGGRGFATVKASHVHPGGRSRLAIQAERTDRGRAPLVAGVLIVALYLWFFRDLPASRRSAQATPQRPNGST
jgi:hypothetical protein